MGNAITYRRVYVWQKFSCSISASMRQLSMNQLGSGYSGIGIRNLNSNSIQYYKQNTSYTYVFTPILNTESGNAELQFQSGLGLQDLGNNKGDTVSSSSSRKLFVMINSYSNNIQYEELYIWITNINSSNASQYAAQIGFESSKAVIRTYVAEPKYTIGSYIENVISVDQSKYPKNGYQNGFWYTRE